MKNIGDAEGDGRGVAGLGAPAIEWTGLRPKDTLVREPVPSR
jgi:hypothetical protein